MIEIRMVWIIKIRPIVIGWFINKNKNDIIKFKENRIIIIQRIVYNKILILEINDKRFFFSEVLKEFSYFWFTRSIFLLNY